jgi:hypothetical protein
MEPHYEISVTISVCPGQSAIAVAKPETVEKNPLIPVSTRWKYLRSTAGSLRNLGLDENGIYDALKNFAANRCEDGNNYPDEKIRALAACTSNERSIPKEKS